MPVASGDVIRVSIEGKWNGADDIVNVYHMLLASGLTESDATTLADMEAIWDTLYTGLQQIATPELIWTGGHVVNVTQGLIVGDFTFTPQLQGTATGDTLSTVSSALLVFPTGVPRRQGRKYLGPLAASLIDSEGLVGTAVAGVIMNFATPLLGEISGPSGVWRYVVYSEATATWTLPVSAKVMQVPGVQRRRKIGRGS